MNSIVHFELYCENYEVRKIKRNEKENIKKRKETEIINIEKKLPIKGNPSSSR